MVVDDFNVIEVIVFLRETDAVLVVDANTVLPLPVTVQLFEVISGRFPQIIKVCRVVDHNQLSQRNPLDVTW